MVANPVRICILERADRLGEGVPDMQKQFTTFGHVVTIQAFKRASQQPIARIQDLATIIYCVLQVFDSRVLMHSRMLDRRSFIAN